MEEVLEINWFQFTDNGTETHWSWMVSEPHRDSNGGSHVDVFKICFFPSWRTFQSLLSSTFWGELSTFWCSALKTFKHQAGFLSKVKCSSHYFLSLSALLFVWSSFNYNTFARIGSVFQLNIVIIQAYNCG